MYNQNEFNEAKLHKNNAVYSIDKVIDNHISKNEYKQSHLLSYWFEEFSVLHNTEQKYLNKNYYFKKYKRGQIIKVNLGYNIGHELGGLHFALVLDKKDNIKNGTLTILPFSSQKNNSKQKNGIIQLDNEIFKQLQMEFSKKEKEFHDKIKNSKINEENLLPLTQTLGNLIKERQRLLKYDKKSIIKLNQITTISKLRIYNDSLIENIKLSKNTLELIDDEIIKYLTEKNI